MTSNAWSQDTAAGPEATIAPGDQVALSIWREPDMSGEFSVDELGQLTLPRLGVIEVRGMSARVLQDSLRTAYSRYLRNPSVEVNVLRRVGVHGEVREPDLYWVDLTTTLREVIAMAGGLTEAGDPRKVVIVRDGQQMSVDSQTGDTYFLQELRSGDQVVVGRRSWFALNPLTVITSATAVISLIVGVLVPLL